MKRLNDRLPELLVITGHQRSGTTMLNAVCDAHPDIMMTFEFENLVLPQPYATHVRKIRKDWWKRRIITAGRTVTAKKLNSFVFLVGYLFWLWVYSRGETVTSEAMRKTLHRIFPKHRVIGDKYPRYVWQLSSFDQPHTKYVFIYRDGRDVLQSVLNRSWADSRFDRIQDTAAYWVEAIEIMGRNREQLLMIRYEDMVTNPQSELKRLADYLGVDAAGFDHEMIRSSSIGKYKEFLTEEQLAEFMAVAGPTLERLGYLVDEQDS